MKTYFTIKLRLFLYRMKMNLRFYKQKIIKLFKKEISLTSKGKIYIPVKKLPYKVTRPTFWVRKKPIMNKSRRRDQVLRDRKMEKKRNQKLRTISARLYRQCRYNQI